METGDDNRLPHPRKNANFFATLTFWWMIPIFKKGLKQELKESDLFQTSNSQCSDINGNILERAWLKENIKAKENGRDPSLTRVLISTFGLSILGFGLRFAFVEMIVKMLQPIALGKLVLYFSTTEADSKLYIIFYSSVIVLCSILSSFIHHPTILATFNKSLKIKVSLASLIYRKSLRLSKNALQNVSVGHMVNLLSSDLNSLDLICFFCHHLWVGPIVTILSTVIMYYEIGLSAILGVVMILFTIAFQSWIIKFYAALKKKGATKTDERLELMNELIKGIQVIKMYVWEKPFTEIINLIRRNEMKLIKYSLYIKGLHVAFTVFRTRSAIFISILTFVVSGNILTAKNVFVITACFNAMRNTMTDYFTFSIEQAKVAKVSIKRIEKFLLQEEVKPITKYTDFEDQKELIIGTNIKNESKENKIVLKEVYASWNSEHSKFLLQNIDFEFNSPGFYAIIGAVGSGKSTILNLILQELHPNEGTIITKGSISYFSQEPWLFSSSIRQNILFGNIYKEQRYKEVIKVCSLQEDFNNFPFGDQTKIGHSSTTLSGGQKIRIHLARAIYKEADIYLLDDPFSGLDTNVSNQIFFNCINSYLKNKICVLVTHQHQYLKQAKEIIVLEKGEIKCKGNYENIQTELSNFINISSTISDIANNESKEIQDLEVKYVFKTQKQTEEHRKKGRVKWDTYKTYFNACGNVCYAFFVFMLFVLAQFFASAGDYFLKYWVNLEQSHSFNTSLFHFDSQDTVREYCIYSYSTITVTTIIVTLFSCFIFYSTSTRASTNLHNVMLKRIMQATMHFFNANSSGTILNRFSKDIEVADVVMPYALINCMQIILSIFGVIILVSLVNAWLLIPTIVAFFILNYLRTIYLTVSSNIKRLENTTRSPLINHLSTSAQGLSTIRAFKSQIRLQMEFDATQNIHTTARFLSIAANRMFAMWLEMICAVYLALVVFSFLIFGNEYGGSVGLAITQVMGMMGSIQWGIRQSSELENHMVSIERIIEYCEIEDIESEKTVSEKLDKWPEDGKIEFKNVCLFYEENINPILKNISFIVKAKQKIGIIGRTGSGKSSIINAIFQLSKTTGEIIIDDINVEELNLNQLRSKISIIPQEPVLFSGNLRKNLDPFDEHEDAELIKALKDINFYEKSVLMDGLNTQITENGSNFSVGQKQLICLARAIIRNNKILILDEATANIDPETENIIQNIVKTKFDNHTVLTIAHRLDTIVDSDMILVMEDGHIKEYDEPHILMRNNNSYLKKILQETGKTIKVVE